MNMINSAIDSKAEVFVQVGCSYSRMFNWMVDVHIDREYPLAEQSYIVAALTAVCNRVHNNVTRHAHGLELLNQESKEWLTEYWPKLKRMRK